MEIREARNQAKAESPGGTMTATGDSLQTAAASFSKKTSIGLDLWAPYEVARCPKEDLDQLGLLHMKWDTDITTPGQWLTNQGSLLPKKVGHRIVGTMATGWRVNTTLQIHDDAHWNKEVSLSLIHI